MKFKVYLLRKRGRRLRWRDVQNGPRHVGHLVTHSCTIGETHYTVLTLRPDDPVAEAPIPELYEPALSRFALLAFRLRGFERLEDSSGGFAVVQEWHCELP